MRIAIFSRYNLAEQFMLATEFRSMLTRLASRSEVMHLSLAGTQKPSDVPSHVLVSELPFRVDRNSPRDILVKTILMYFLLPHAAWRLRKFRPDVIFLSECFPLWALILKLLTGTRVATGYGDWHFHNIFGKKRWARPLLRFVEWLDRFEMRRLSGFFCRAVSASERLQGWGIAPDRIRVVRDAPDPTAYFPRNATKLRRRCGFSDSDVVLLYHGIMHQGKGLDMLISWADQLYSRYPELGLILVGGGPEQQRLRELAAGLPMANRIVFSGWLATLQEVGEYCNAADICIAMRTASEANDRIVPGALLHSMACRKIVIGPRLRGIAEILRHGENGYMFAADDGRDFRRLIEFLIENRKDWPRVANQAFQEIEENFSVEAVARQYAEAIEHFAVV